MKVKIRGIVDHGHNDERIILDVISDEEIGNFMIFDTTYTKIGSVSNKVRHSYWFPDQRVKQGDVVVLYTRKGNRESVKNQDASVTYFFFWGLDSNVWNNEGDCGLLMHIDDWQSHKVVVSSK